MRTNTNPGRLRTSPLDKERWEGTGGKEGIRVFQEEQCTELGNEKTVVSCRTVRNSERLELCGCASCECVICVCMWAGT